MKTVAFVISEAEADILKRMPRETRNNLEGTLFWFKQPETPALIAALGRFAMQYSWPSPEFQACLRLQERLASWIGKQLADPDKIEMFTTVGIKVDPNEPTPASFYSRNRQSNPVA